MKRRTNLSFQFPPSAMTGFMLLFLALPYCSGGANEYVNTQNQGSALTIDLSSATTGVDINFWIKRALVHTEAFNFLQISTDLILQLGISGGDGDTKLKSIYAGSTNFENSIGLTEKWVNIGIQIKYSNYIKVHGWIGNYYEIAPSFTQKFTSISGFAPGNAVFLLTANNHGVFWAEFRAFTLDEISSWAYFLRNYALSSPFPTSIVKYARTSTSHLYADFLGDAGTFVTLSEGFGDTDFPLCSRGFKFDNTNACTTSCTATGCNYCQVVGSLFQDSCRECNEAFTACFVTVVCPLDYYKDGGICYRCPIGCSECTSDTVCTGCDSGLTLTTNGADTLCKCPSGQFETADAATDVLSCTACDNSCAECVTDATTCTSCASPNYLLGSTCVASCGVTKWADDTDRTCKDCGVDCDVCTDSATCTDCTGVDKFIHLGVCVAACPTATLTDNGNCLPCANGCEVCTPDVNTCTSCKEGFYLKAEDNLCHSNCGDGKYGDNADRLCKTCLENCTLCLAENTCTKCITTHFLINFQCKEECPAGYYQDTLEADNQFCRICSSTCTACDNQDKCTGCQSNVYKYTISADEVMCIDDCPAGYWNNAENAADKQCTACSVASCTNCSSTSNCH